MRDRDEEPNSLPEIDLHHLTRPEAERRLSQELHACRVRGIGRILVITGRGYGNPTQAPVLRTHIEQWLAGPDAKRKGVQSFKRAHRDGALEVTLAVTGGPGTQRA